YDPTAGSGSSLIQAATTPASQPDPRQIRSFQAIRQASGQRGGMRGLPPIASLAVPSAPSEPTPPQPAEVLPAQPPQAWPALDVNTAPLPAVVAPIQSNGHAPVSNGTPIASVPLYAPQPHANGYHPTGPIATQAPVAASNGYAPQVANASVFTGYRPQAGRRP